MKSVPEEIYLACNTRMLSRYRLDIKIANTLVKLDNYIKLMISLSICFLQHKVLPNDKNNICDYFETKSKLK